MHKFQRRRSSQPFVYSWPAFFAIMIVAGFVGRAAWNAYGNDRAAREQYAAARASREETESRQVELQKKLDELSRPYGIEKELRARYSLRKPGEEVVIFIQPEGKTASPETPAAERVSLFSSWFEQIRVLIPSL